MEDGKRRIEYAWASHGAGVPLLLLHGFTGSAQSWAPHVSFFAQRYRVITLDLPGHGRTDAPADPLHYRMEACAEDILALLETLTPEPAHLLGYSMGGRLALYLALTAPQRFRSLILESASPGLATAAERHQRREHDNALADRIEQQGIAWFVDFWEQRPLFHSHQQLPPAMRAALRRQRLQNNPRGLANSLRGMGTGVQPSLWDRLNTLTLPVLLLAGALDPKFVAINEQMAALLPAAHLQVIPQTGHTIHLEQPAAFRKAVAAWLSRLA